MFKDVHRSIGMTTSEVNKSNENLVLHTHISSNETKKKSKMKFKIGDHVRITKFKRTFVNKYDPNWTQEIFFN